MTQVIALSLCRLDRSAVRGTGQRLRLRCACGVLAAPAIRRAGHGPIAEPGLALVRQPAGLAHCLDGDRSPVRLCLGPAREGAAHKTADHGGARITEARRFVPGPNSGIDSVPKSMYAAFAAAGLGQLSEVWGEVSAASGAAEMLNPRSGRVGLSGGGVLRRTLLQAVQEIRRAPRVGCGGEDRALVVLRTLIHDAI